MIIVLNKNKPPAGADIDSCFVRKNKSKTIFQGSDLTSDLTYFENLLGLRRVYSTK